VRETDTVARLGGDEFVVIQCGTASTLDVTKLARRIETVIAAPIQVEEHVVGVGASIGIAIAPGDDTDPDGLLQKADSALYRAKAAGGGSYVFYTAPRPAVCTPAIELQSTAA
jgi:diguanylate cyclase (GGDEF)-like protein